MTAPKQPEPAQPQPSKTEAKNEVERLAERLDKLEAQKHSGAAHRTPKARMLDASAIEKKNPDQHFLYVNTEDPGNLQTHLEDGYTALSEDECKAAGVRHRVGELVLMKIPRKEFEERMEAQRELARSRLDAHKAEFRGEMESIVRELRDRGYREHDIRRLMVDE